MKVGLPLLLVVFVFNLSHSQSKTSGRSSSRGSLTVTVTVVPSVRLVAEPNGKRDVIVSNAPDSKESFFLAPSRPVSQVDSNVQFSFPGAPPQYEVTKKTVMMTVDVGGKTEQRQVILTTGVPR